MMHYSVQSRDQIFIKGYGFLSFATTMSKNVCKIISKNVSAKNSKKLLDHAKQSATDSLETVLKRWIQKTAESIEDLIVTKIANKITKVS